MDSENDEEGVIPYKTKYRQLKRRLKYLIYEHECFENDIQKAQMTLLQLSRDKNFLLDQLMRYEAVVLSGGEETDYSSGDETLHPHPPLSDREKSTESRIKSEAMEHSLSSSSSSVRVAATKSPAGGVIGGGGGVSRNTTTTTLLHNTASHSTANSASKTAPSLTVKSGGVRKATKSTSVCTKVSATAVAKITKAVARARQTPQQLSPTVIVSTSPLIVSLPLGTAAGGGRGKPQHQATPMVIPLVKHTPQIMSLSSGASSQSTTAAILASIPAPAKPPRPRPLLVPSVSSRPSGKGTSSVGVVKGAGSRGQGGASSSSSTSSSSDSEESGSESSTSGSSHDEEEEEEGMDTRGPVSIVHSVPVPAGAPQLLRPKAIVSPVKAPPPKLIPMSDHPSVSSGGGPSSSPLSATPPGGGATRFLWSNRGSGGSEGGPSLGFVSIAPLSSPNSLSKSSSGSAFQLVASPPGSAPLARPPSVQDL